MEFVRTMDLTSKQRAQLRGLANGIDTILIVGKEGIGDNLVKQANDALEARELIKGRVLENALMSAREAAEALAPLTRSEVVQVIGTKFVLYRQSHRKEKKERQSLERVFGLFPRLKERIHQVADTLSGGEQQMLAIARGLMAKPRLLMLDEPGLGLAPIIVNQIMDILKEVNEEGTTILLIEQNARKALKLCDRAYLMNVGNIVTEGTGKELLADSTLMEAYLGQ